MRIPRFQSQARVTAEIQALKKRFSELGRYFPFQ